MSGKTLEEILEISAQGNHRAVLSCIGRLSASQQKKKAVLLLKLRSENRLQDLPSAVETAKLLSKHANLSGEYYIELAGLSTLLARPNSARKYLLKAAASHFDDELVKTELGITYEQQGLGDQAIEFYNEVVFRTLRQGRCDLITVRAFRRLLGFRCLEETEINFLKKVSGDGNLQLSKSILFVLAQDACKKKDYSLEISYLRRANALAKELDVAKGVSWSREAAKRLTRKIEQSDFHSILPEREQSGVSKGFYPIFILAMPRSGTTLVEQIITASGQAESTGESRAFSHAFESTMSRLKRDKQVVTVSPYDKFKELSPPAKQEIAVVYRRYQKLLTSSDTITDKNLSNVLWVSVISSLFPNARFVHVIRNPLDNCVSLLQQNFDNAPYACDPEFAAVEYLEYKKRMILWKKLLPESVYFIEYERLVSDYEVETKKLYQFLGLEWSAEVLSFNRGSRSVRTPSISQVRQGINNQSVNKWQRYSELLGSAIAYINDNQLDHSQYLS